MTRTRSKLNRGLAYMAQGKFKAAIKNFESAVRSGDGTNVERDASAWWMCNASTYRKEWKKQRYGNANLKTYDVDNGGNAWSDVEIAAVLLTPNTHRMNDYLVKFLGRSPEAIRFQRRYVHGRPLKSWLGESGERYTRYTQTKVVGNKIGA